MKTILLIRHAKSSWENFSVADINRPLNDRGKRNAPEMAARLLKKNISIDAFLSSPAKRALSTAKLFCEIYKRDPDDIIVVPELYEPSSSAFTKAIINAPENALSIAIFSHNPGITAFANALISETGDQLQTSQVDALPTCGVFAVHYPINSWKSFEPGHGAFYFFDYPRNH